MDTTFELLERTRRTVLATTDELSRDELMRIPEGFTNNILWNWGHMVVSQQLLTYGLLNLPLGVDDTLLQRFRKGTSPRDWQGEVDVDKLRELSVTLIERTREDYARGRLDVPDADSRFPYRTSFGGELQSLAEAVQFNNLHEGLHLGVIQSLNKLVTS